MQLERLPWKSVVATLVATVVVTYGVVEHRATPRSFPSPGAAVGVGRAFPPGLPPSSASTGMPITINQPGMGIGSPHETRASAPRPSSPKIMVPTSSKSAPAASLAGAPDAGLVALAPRPDADGASAEVGPPAISNDQDHLEDRPSPEDESALMSLPRPLTSSSFDDEDLVDRHPVSDDQTPFIRNPPPLTSSSFDDEELVDRHPVSDDLPPFMRNPPPLTSSSFDDEDLVDRHPVSDDLPPFIRNPPPLTSSSFDDEDLVDRHPVLR